ncbi:MAG: hypothetical protein JSS91_13095 [Bacteroidetes bacterium]|nr:hypothetical protein [Bacteroidota bacterium]
MSKRDLDRILLLKYNAITKEIESDPVSDPNSLHFQFLIHTEMKNSRTNLRDDLMNKSYTESIDAVSVLYLRILFFYISHIITFHTEKKYISKIAVEFYNHFNKSGFINGVDSFGEKYSVYLKMINYILLIIEDKNDADSFNSLKKLLRTNSKRFSRYERISCFAVMLRFCSYQNLKYNNLFSVESFEIYTTILNEKLFLEYSPFLQLSFCRNYIIRCISLRKLNNVKKFIREYNEYFSQEYKKHLNYYCRSLISFEEKKFERSLSFISKFELDNAVFKKDLRILKIKIFYELNYPDSLFSESDSFRHFISSNITIEPAIKNKTKNFIKYAAALSKLKDIHSKNDLLILKNKIENDNKVSEKKWLLDKIKEQLRIKNLKRYKLQV